MKRYIIMLALVAVVAINSGWATDDSTLSIAKYFPSGALLFARSPDLKKLLPAIKNHPLARQYMGSKADEKFRASKLYMKLGDRFKDSEKLSGIGISYDKLLEIAGDESALALYNIGDLKMVFLTAVPREKAMKSQFGLKRERFEERRKGDQVYYVVAEEGGAVFAFAMVDRWLLVSNDLKRFEQSLSLLGGAAEDNLAGSSQFKSAIPESFQPGDLTLVLDQQSLNEDLYFTNYWVHRNVEGLRWIQSETLNLRLGASVIEEQRWFTLNAEAAGAPARVTVSELARWPQNTMWLDVNTNCGGDSRIAPAMALWAMGDDAKSSDGYLKEILTLVEPARPVAIARLAVPRTDANGFWLDERRLIAVKLGDPKSLKGSELRNAIAKRWSERLGAGGLVKASFAAREGIETLSLPLMDGAGPAILEKSGLLVISNDAALIREYMSAPAAPGLDAANNSFTRIEAGKSAAHISRLYSMLAERANWRYADSETFFEGEAPALLKTIAGVKLMLIRGRLENNRYIEDVRYELAR